MILVANLHRKHSNQQKVYIRNIRFLTKRFYAELKLGEGYSYMKNIFLTVFIRLGRRARIELERVHFGVFSTSSFVPPALSSD